MIRGGANSATKLVPGGTNLVAVLVLGGPTYLVGGQIRHDST